MENEVIIMKSEVYVVMKVLKKTKALLFQDVEVGDQLMFSSVLKTAGTNKGKTYASYIQTTNITKNDYTYSSFNQLPKLMAKFELEPL